MANSLNELVNMVRDWSNRDEEVVTDSLIEQWLAWSADSAYRTLRVPPLETTLSYSSSDVTVEGPIGGVTVSSFNIPNDLIEIIQISVLDANGSPTRIIEHKADVRTFFNPSAEKYSNYATFTRKGGKIYFTQNLSGNEASVELYYYRRLPALGSHYSNTVDNFDASGSFLEVTADQTDAVTTNEALYLILDTNGDPVTVEANVFDTTNTVTASDAATPDNSVGIWKIVSKEVVNWLTSQNERVLVFGAVGQVFSFVQEDDQAQKFTQMHELEILKLNDEDVKRNSAGGNVQINFNARGMI